MKTVAEKCGEKFDEDLLEDAFLKNELFDYFKTMRLFEVRIRDRHKPKALRVHKAKAILRQGFYNQLICEAQEVFL